MPISPLRINPRQYTIAVTESLHRRLKVLAAAQEKPMYVAVEELLDEVLTVYEEARQNAS